MRKNFLFFIFILIFSTMSYSQNTTEDIKKPSDAMVSQDTSVGNLAMQKEGIIPSIKFKEADIEVVISAIQEKAVKDGKKINIVLTPKVKGPVTISLENVDWQTALDVLLKTYGYASIKYKDIIIVGTYDEIKERETQDRERQGVESSQIKVFKLKYLDANDAKKLAEPLLSPIGKISVLEITGQAGWEFGQDVTKRKRAKEGVVSRTKVLVISDISRKLEEIEDMLKEIDVKPKQILIKAKIVEVSRDLLKDIGLDWGTGQDGVSSGFSQLTLSSKDNSPTKSLGGHILSTSNTPSVFRPKTEGLDILDTGLRLVFKKLTGTEFEAILHALEEDVRSNVLSSPVILTLNNQEASILVGEKFPIIKTEVSTETNQIIGGSLDRYQDIGIQLNVVPQICGENEEFINMILHPAVTSYTSTSKVTSAQGVTLVEYPIIISREAETQILIKDGETIVIGGLTKDIKSKQFTGIPFLSRIPIIGAIFGTHTTDTEKVDLLIFISANIVNPGEILPEQITSLIPINIKSK